MLTVGDALKISKHDAILTHVLQVSRAYLHAHPEYVLSQNEYDQFRAFSADYEKGKPLAYITGHKEFWSLDLLVNEEVLIPRPETETLVECVLQIFMHQENLTIADLGTGSGAIALALAKEKPNSQIYATDLSLNALQIAKMNAEKLQLKNIHFIKGHWLKALPNITFDAIVSNPPYIGHDDPFVEKNVADFEPHMALFSKNDGLQAIHEIISQAGPFLKPGGYLFLEHGFQQAERIRSIFAEVGYTDMMFLKDQNLQDRVGYARKGTSA